MNKTLSPKNILYEKTLLGYLAKLISKMKP